MKGKKYENYQDFIRAFDSTPEEIIKRETYDLLKLYNQTQQQLQEYKDKEDKLREYITSYESISIIQGLDNIVKNKGLDENTMIEMTNRYLEVHDKLLQILNEGDK